MFTFLVTFLGVLLLYLLLVWGSGDAATAYFTVQELVAGIVLSLISAGTARAMLGKAKNKGLFLKWPLFLIYVFTVFFASLAKANIDVAYRVLTGRISPGIVRIKPGLKTDLGRTILANSITLTPGTLTVDIDSRNGDMFIHWINVRETDSDEERLKAVCGSFPKWARRVSE